MRDTIQLRKQLFAWMLGPGHQFLVSHFRRLASLIYLDPNQIVALEAKK